MQAPARPPGQDRPLAQSVAYAVADPSAALHGHRSQHRAAIEHAAKDAHPPRHPVSRFIQVVWHNPVSLCPFVPCGEINAYMFCLGVQAAQKSAGWMPRIRAHIRWQLPAAIAMRAHDFQDPKSSTLDFGPQQAQSMVALCNQGRCKLCQGTGSPLVWEALAHRAQLQTAIHQPAAGPLGQEGQAPQLHCQ